MENFENFENFFPREEKVNFRKAFIIILNNWYLFLIFGLLGIIGGYIYSRYSQPDYLVKAAIFTPQKSASIGAGLEDLFKSQLTNNKSEVYNQIEIIKSFNINLQVAQNLNWRTTWFQKDHFNWKACYKDEPFDVQEQDGAFNSPGVKLNLKQFSPQQYELKAEGDIVTKGVRKAINFTAQGTFGQPFVNEYFHFTITPNSNKADNAENHYYFTFNESAQIASDCLKNLVVKMNDKQSEIIRLQLLGKQPERNIDYLNELISVYMQNKLNFQTETQKRSLQFIDDQLIGFSDSLKSAGTNFSQFKARNQIVNIGEQGTMVMATLQTIESEKNKNQMQLDYFRNMLDYLGKSFDAKQLIAPSVVGIQDLSLNTMVVALSELYSRRQILSFSAKENNPTLVMIDKEIAQTNARLKENLQNLIKNAEVLNNSFERQKNTIKAQLNQLPQKEQDMINFQRRFELTNEIYTFLLQKRAEIDIALAGATAEVQVIDSARIETTDLVGLSALSKIIIGLLLGLSLPVIFLIIASMISDTIKLQEDIEKNTQLAVLGNVMRSHTKSDTAVNDNPRSGIAESYRSIRTNLQFMFTADNKKVVAIHSTNPGEGKSFTSVNLATILAMNNKKVILVGVDLRKPRTHKILNIANDRGLSTFLSGHDQLDNIIFKTTIKNLSLIPGGPIPPNPSELLDKPEMEMMFDTLRGTYDYIILDNAPISMVTDGFITGRYADLNIFILRYGISKIDQINYINQIADKKVLGNLALIINDIYGSGFGHGRDYYYNKYSDNRNGYYEEPEKPGSGFKKFFGWA